MRILTTHGLTHLPHCDLIVVMDGGRIVEQGSYSELIENNGTFAELLYTYANMESKGVYIGITIVLFCQNKVSVITVLSIHIPYIC